MTGRSEPGSAGASILRDIGRITIAAALLSTASTAVAQPEAGAPGDGFDVERYSLTLRPDLPGTAIAGTETIVVRATSDAVMQLAFTANALRISEATLDGRPVGTSSNKRAIVFTLPRPMRRGSRATLRFRFDGTPARGVTAVAGGIYTSYFACDWMVCLQDAPGDKAHLRLNLELPRGSVSVGNGRAGPTSAMSDGLVVHRWRTTRPYSPYLFAFAAGPFARSEVAGSQVNLVGIDATGERNDIAASFTQTSAMAAFFADRAGMSIPDRRYTQVLVPGREAQEAAGFSLIGKAELDRERDEPAAAWVIAHELAHQWWGNLVTCSTWQDFWLNEGIATFMVAAWKERSIGPAAYRQELEVARGRLERVREIGFDKPLAWDGKYPNLGARRAVQYSKGALFLDHLRTSVGDDAFWLGIRRFTRTHAGGTVTSRDFQTIMETASGRDLSSLFAEWVYGK